MSKSVFKENSRFSILKEDVDDIKQNKKEQPKNPPSYKEKDNFNEKEKSESSSNYFTRPSRNYREMEELKRKEILKAKKEKEELEKKKLLEFTEHNYPELGSGLCNNVNKNVNTNSSLPTFIDKLNTKINVVSNEEIDDVFTGEPGWIEMKRDCNSRNIIKKYVKGERELNTTADMAIDIDINEEQDLFYKVVDNLAKLHEKRTQEYIDMWGYDEYEKMFIFKNFEYGYFDRLDEEEYEEDLENNENYDSEFDNIYDDEYNNYY